MIDSRPRYIQQIVSDYEAMCQEVLEQMNRVMVLVSVPVDAVSAQLIAHYERVIDGMENKLHNDVMRSIVLYTPKATDSRQIISYFDMAGNLERVGDLLVNVVKYFHQIDYDGDVYASLRPSVEQLFEQVKSNLQTAIFAFSCGDVATARDVIVRDDLVDALYKKVCDQVPQTLMTCSGELSEVNTALQVFGLAYCLERIGDHGSNIAESTIYTYEGTLLKHKYQGEE